MRNQPTKILVVEDSEADRGLIAAYLEHCGCRVLQAGDGITGHALARAEQPDVILMDCGLPGIDGWQSTELMKADPATAHIPVIALTGHVGPGHERRSMEAGCESYIAKPAPPRRVYDEIARVVGLRREDTIPRRARETAAEQTSA